MQTVLVIGVTVAFAFVVGVVLSQKIKDWFAGVPAHVRTDLSAVEATLLGKLKSMQAAVVADFKAKVTPPTPVLQTAAPAPNAPAPASV